MNANANTYSASRKLHHTSIWIKRKSLVQLVNWFHWIMWVTACGAIQIKWNIQYSCSVFSQLKSAPVSKPNLSQSSSIKKIKHPECCVLIIVSISYVKFNKFQSNWMEWNIRIRQKRSQLFVENRMTVKLSNIRMLSNANTNFVTSLATVIYLSVMLFYFHYVQNADDEINTVVDFVWRIAYFYFLRATAECFAHLSHRLGVCPSVRLSVRPSVTLVICIKTVQARITKSLLWAAPKCLVYRNKISCHWVQGFSNEGVKEGYPPYKDVILPLLARIMWKRLQIGTYMLLIITSTSDRLLRFINIDDLERPWTPQKGVFSVFFCNFWMLRTFQHWIATKWLEIDQDILRMKFSALNVDFSSLSPDPLDSRRPA